MSNENIILLSNIMFNFRTFEYIFAKCPKIKHNIA